MLSVEERFGSAVRDLNQGLAGVTVSPPSAVIRRSRRRRYMSSAVAAVFVLAMFGGLAAIRDSRRTVPVATTTEPTASLLFPLSFTLDQSLAVTIGPEDPNRAAGLVVSPSGVPYRLVVESASRVPVSQGETRTFNGTTFAANATDGVFAYTAVDPCAHLTVIESSRGADAWTAEVTALLDALTLSNGQAELALPDGWQSLGFGISARVVRLTYRLPLGGATRNVTLTQTVGSPIATLPGLDVGSLTRARFNGEPAWLLARDNERSLIWNDTGNAVMLTTSDVTVDQLTRHAAVDLQHDQPDAWRAAMDRATAPTNDTRVDPRADTCATPTVTITE